jgi:16S rRNA (cytosine967-C5)-methyltransferase
VAKAPDERLLCCDIIGKLLAGQGSLASQLHAELRQLPGLNFALLQEYCYGLCRWYGTLDCWAGQLLDKPLRRKDQDVHCLILLGLYQLFFMRTPAHAAINETVAAAARLGKPWAKALVNALLREAQRSEAQLRAASDADYSRKYAHPEWLLRQLKQDWPAQYRELLDANNQRAPMTLRVNLQRSSRDDYLQRLQAAGITASAGSLSPTAVVLQQPLDVTQLPGFGEGLVSVQDEASQLLPLLLPTQPGQRILDACAAPGGKTCALLEHEPTLQLLCLDNEAKRLPRLRDNLARCALQATVLEGDITQGLPPGCSGDFDSILLDAPCSATGVIRRHPDIKLLRTPDEVAALVHKQQQLLEAAWSLLKQGGHLLYSTCSLLKAENELQITRFLQQHGDARLLPLHYAGNNAAANGLQLFPQAGGPDGFYYALLQKW